MAVFCLLALGLLVWFQPFGGGARLPATTQGRAGESVQSPSTEEANGHPAATTTARARSNKWNIGSVLDGDEPLPIRRVRTPSGHRRFVSLLVAAEPDTEPGEPADDDPAEGEPSDLDDDHPGSYWANLGYSSLRAVLSDLGIDADRAWIDSPTGEILVSQDIRPVGTPGPAGSDRLLVLAPEPTPGDIDGDGTATALDVARFLERFAAKDAHADINLDGAVNQADMVEFLRLWSEGAG